MSEIVGLQSHAIQRSDYRNARQDTLIYNIRSTKVKHT